MLELDRLTVTIAGSRVVDEVSLRVPRGTVAAVLGPSGCGKSTLLRAVAGLERLTAGSVIYDGEDLTAVPTHRRGFALMFQDGQLFPNLSVADNVAYPLRLRRTPQRERAARVHELLTMVGLAELAARSTTSLSGGERQRVALARALAVRPRLLLLDEPLSALDRDLRERLAGEVSEILRAERTTALFVTHDHEEAFTVADSLAVMRAGRVVQAGTLEEVWRSPADPATARFLGYAAVVTGAAARPLLIRLPPPLGPSSAGATGPAGIALRRSALRVTAVVGQETPDRLLRGGVVSARTTPEQTRLVVEVEGVGRLDAVAALGVPLRPRQRVALELDPTRVALVPSPGAEGDPGHAGPHSLP